MQQLMVDNYFYKPRMLTARRLHQLYASEHVNVPTAESIAFRHIQFRKKINEDLKNVIDKDSADADVMELCMLIDMDFEDIEPMDFECGGKYV